MTRLILQAWPAAGLFRWQIVAYTDNSSLSVASETNASTLFQSVFPLDGFRQWRSQFGPLSQVLDRLSGRFPFEFQFHWWLVRLQPV